MNDEIIKCSDCGEEKLHHAFGLCINCYKKQYRSRLIICKNCGEEKQHQAKGLCKKCYNKQYRMNAALQ